MFLIVVNAVSGGRSEELARLADYSAGGERDVSPRGCADYIAPIVNLTASAALSGIANGKVPST